MISFYWIRVDLKMRIFIFFFFIHPFVCYLLCYSFLIVIFSIWIFFVFFFSSKNLSAFCSLCDPLKTDNLIYSIGFHSFVWNEEWGIDKTIENFSCHFYGKNWKWGYYVGYDDKEVWTFCWKNTKQMPFMGLVWSSHWRYFFFSYKISSIKIASSLLIFLHFVR